MTSASAVARSFCRARWSQPATRASRLGSAPSGASRKQRVAMFHSRASVERNCKRVSKRSASWKAISMRFPLNPTRSSMLPLAGG